MSSRLRWAGVVGFMALLALVVASCAPAATPTPEAGCPDRIIICWTPPDITGVFRTATDYWLLSAADARTHGINVDVVSQAPTSHIAFAAQVDIIEDFVARGCDVIGISPIEVEVVIPAIQKANEAGIPVIIVNLLEPIAGVDVASYIGFDNTIAGRISAFALVDYFGGPGVLGTGREVDIEPGTYLDLAWWEELYETITEEERAAVKAKVAIIEGIAGGFFSRARVNGFHSVVDEFPGIEIVGMLPADWNREKGIKAAEDFLTANPPGELDAIWAASNEMGLGAMLAAEGAGRLELAGEGEVGDAYVAIFTNDVTPESADRVAEGKMVAETHHGFPEWGWYGTEFGVTMACGGEVPEIFDIRPRTMYKENARLFYPEPALESIDWETIKAGGSPRMH
ncbi:MAG TPA: ABC transporter substrate-binding protein [Chloroflexi bacterium]|nr:ABC transporter substrate-binding protein [Chloroflexota bacterium]